MHQGRLLLARGGVTTSIPFDVFVYGTLKTGHANHDRFCAGVFSVRPARTRGSLYDLPFGFPGLVVPLEAVRATGTRDYEEDARRQRSSTDARPGTDAGVVHGQLLTFDDPITRLPALDGLEGYEPGQRSLYERVLIPIEVAGNLQVAWAYALTRPAGTLLSEGSWPG